MMHFLTRDLFLKSLRDVSFSVSLHFFSIYFIFFVSGILFLSLQDLFLR